MKKVLFLCLFLASCENPWSDIRKCVQENCSKYKNDHGALVGCVESCKLRRQYKLD